MKKKISFLSLLLVICLLASACNVNVRINLPEENREAVSLTRDDWSDDVKMTTEDIINTWSLKQEAGKNDFDFNTGFLTEYAGYHTHP